ncbi:MAG: universal stress protein [Caldilineaceae bacterium]
METQSNRRLVLVPVDGSTFGRQIFPILTRLLQPQETDLILMRVGEPVGSLVGAPPRPAGNDGLVMAYDTLYDATHAAHPIYASQSRESVLADFIVEIMPDARALDAAGFQVNYELRFGHPGEQIVNFVNTHQVDLIAMTTHWRTGINRLLFGNTVQYITPRVRVPLLMLRPEGEEEA